MNKSEEKIDYKLVQRDKKVEALRKLKKDAEEGKVTVKQLAEYIINHL